MYKLLELCIKLNELGHPHYLTTSSLPPIYCSEKEEDMCIRVFEMQRAVEECLREVSELRSRYTWLLYFSIPKMLLLHKQIHSPSRDIDVIVHEISYIVYNQKIEITELRQGVLVSLSMSFIYFHMTLVDSEHLKTLFLILQHILCKWWDNSWRTYSATHW